LTVHYCSFPEPALDALNVQGPSESRGLIRSLDGNDKEEQCVKYTPADSRTSAQLGSPKHIFSVSDRYTKRLPNQDLCAASHRAIALEHSWQANVSTSSKDSVETSFVVQPGTSFTLQTGQMVYTLVRFLGFCLLTARRRRRGCGKACHFESFIRL